MLIDKLGIARLIPHAGAMCLLDGVLNWDLTQILCVTDTHRAMDNPLRRNGQLGTLCGVEYAAQAMAVHGALADRETPGSDRPRIGYLASLRAVSVFADRLDRLPAPLTVEAQRLDGDADRAIFAYTLRYKDRIVMCGRAAVVLIGRET